LTYNIRKRNEVELEREPGSVWCACIQVLSAHGIHTDEDYFSPTRRSFECVFEAFGDATRLIGDVVGADGGSSEVKFTSNETKYLFSSSISALEALFETMDPIILKFKPLEDNPQHDIPQFLRTVSLSAPKVVRTKKLAVLPSSKDLLKNRKSSGSMSIQNLHKDRYVTFA
jgi:hypothetical protein